MNTDKFQYIEQLEKLEFDGEVKQNVNDGTNRRNDCRMETNF